MTGAPAALATARVGKALPERLRYKFEKSTLPSTNPISGMITSLTSEVVILPNAAPSTKPTAKSTTFPLIANCLKSESIDMTRNLLASILPSGDFYITHWHRERALIGDFHSFPRSAVRACARNPNCLGDRVQRVSHPRDSSEKNLGMTRLCDGT